MQRTGRAGKLEQQYRDLKDIEPKEIEPFGLYKKLKDALR